jgi:hypothetical protein
LVILSAVLLVSGVEMKVPGQEPGSEQNNNPFDVTLGCIPNRPNASSRSFHCVLNFLCFQRLSLTARRAVFTGLGLLESVATGGNTNA